LAIAATIISLSSTGRASIATRWSLASGPVSLVRGRVFMMKGPDVACGLKQQLEAVRGGEDASWGERERRQGRRDMRLQVGGENRE